MKRFAESTGIPYQLGSDHTGEVRRIYDVQRRFRLGTSRITYVIDGEGVIRGAFHNELSIGSHIKNALKALQGIAADH